MTKVFNETVKDEMQKSCSNFTYLTVNVTEKLNDKGDITGYRLTKSKLRNIPLSTNEEEIWYENEPVFRIDARAQQANMLRTMMGPSKG